MVQCVAPDRRTMTDPSPGRNAAPVPFPRSRAARASTTADLLARVRRGEPGALQRLVETYRPVLLRWAHGRLPVRARGLLETQDVVQVCLVNVLRRVDTFDPSRPGAFLAYLRQSLLNQLRNEVRNAGRRPFGDEVTEGQADERPSPLEQAIGRETLRAYEQALEELPENQREAVVLRVEMGLPHAEIATLVGYPTANAARMAVSRGLARLATRLGEMGVESPV